MKHYPDRGLLHKQQLEAFKAYLSTQNIAWRPGKGDFEVIQIQHGDGWVPLLRRDKHTEHFTVPGKLTHLARAFVKAAKRSEQETEAFINRYEHAYLNQGEDA